MTSFSTSDCPRWVLMWTIAGGVYVSCKWLTWHQATARHRASWKDAAYLLGWPGMDATTFLGERPTAERVRCHSSEWLGAFGKLILGTTILFAIARMVPPQHPYVVGWIGMIGIVLMLHFGALH